MLRDYRYEFSNEYKLINAIKCALLKDDLENIYVEGNKIEVSKDENTIITYMNGRRYEITIEGNIVIDYQ